MLEGIVCLGNFVEIYIARQQWIKKEGGFQNPPSLFLGGLYVVI